MKSITARELNQDVSSAKRAARLGPVVVTDRGRPTHVLLSIEAYRALSTGHQTIADLLAVPDSESVLDLDHVSMLWRR